jgi:haloalkane dehalogenase
MANEQTVDDVLAGHRADGERFTADGVGSFVLRKGDGAPVVLIHGLPASSFLYRKVVAELATRGLQAIAFDLPGLGLADRPVDFDYSVKGLAAFAAAAADALAIDRFHLVVHDYGGPVGFELASSAPDRIRSLTILNTLLEPSGPPFPGELLAHVVDRAGGPLASPTVWRRLMYRVGIADRTACSPAELDAYRRLALDPDDGRGYLAIMRRLRDGHDADRYGAVVDTRRVPYPIQVVWGGLDPMLSLRRAGWRVLAATHLPSMHLLPAKHYLPEDQAPYLAQLIARQATGG